MSNSSSRLTLRGRSWIARVLIAMATAVTLAAQSGVVRVTVARANVRQAPNDGAPVLTQLTYGAVVELRGVEGDWYRVLVELGAIRFEGYLSRSVAARVDASGGTPAPARAAERTASIAPGIQMAADYGGKTTWIAAVATRVVPLVTAARTVQEAAAASGLDAAISGTATSGNTVPDLAWIWVVPRDRMTAIPATQPVFYAAYHDAPGVNIAELTPALVRLVPAASGWAVVSMVRGRGDAAGRQDADWTIARDLKQDAVKVEITASAPGIMNVRLAAPLPPGEYALVLRPAFANKYPDREILGPDGIGSLFSAAWPLRITR